MSETRRVDVAVLGAGPAGATAALRLLDLGYRVLLCDKREFPRAHVGEALTPGIAHALDVLDARAALDGVPRRDGLPTRRIWQGTEPETLAHSPHAMVDRAAFDAALVDLARARGACCRLGTTPRWSHRPDGSWEIGIRSDSDYERFRARVLLDARGRSGARNVHPTGVRLLATWMDLAEIDTAAEIRLEATPDAWFWGAPLAGGGYRLMAFCDPSNTQLHTQGRERWFRARFRASRLFGDCAPALERRHAMHSCAATPYAANECWHDGWLKLGDAAFALDPLSSSGVEKAMRFSLQAALALNTALREPGETALAEQFLRARLSETVAEHVAWTAQAYARAWPSAEHPFWRVRAAPPESDSATIAAAPPPATLETASMRPAMHWLSAALDAPVRLSPQIAFVETPCAVGDRIQRCLAVSHPRLSRPAAFVDGIALEPLLASMAAAADLRQWLALSAQKLSPDASLRLATWAAQHGLIVGAEQHVR